ncbi:MAG: hypothetical protein KC593_02325 [Myxococcales bacterium]|nr:hypothetical protein [Myxococcales bacterium]MCB9629494.1 hypothetical protein [Sandaracinaceae bacterium]
MLNARALSPLSVPVVVRFALLVMLGVGLAPVHDASALCAMPQPSARILTPLSAPLPAAGSLLVQLEYGYVTAGVPVQTNVNGDFVLPAATLVGGSERIPLVPTRLPGGLVRLDFQRPPAPGRYLLEGLSAQGAGPMPITIGGALPPAPTLPRVTGITHAEREEVYDGGGRGRVRTQHWTTTVSFDRVLSYPNALLVLTPVGAGDAQLLQTHVDVTEVSGEGSSGGRCGSPNVPGRGRVSAGSEVQVVLVDVYGRASAPSASVRVRGAREGRRRDRR